MSWTLSGITPVPFGICTFSSNFLSAYTFLHCSFEKGCFPRKGNLHFSLSIYKESGSLEAYKTAISSRQAHTHDSNLLALNLEAPAATLDHRIWKHAIEEASRRQGSCKCSHDCSVAQSPTVSSSHRCSTSVCRWLRNLRQWRKKENEVSLVLVKREQWGEGSRAEGCSCEMIHSGQETDAWQWGQQCRSLLLLSYALKSRTRYVTGLWVRLLTSEDEYVQYQSILSYFSTSPPNRTGFAPFSWCLSYSTQRYCREKKATSAGCVQASPKLFGLISCKMLGLVQVLQNSCALHSSPKPNGFNKLTVLI